MRGPTALVLALFLAACGGGDVDHGVNNIGDLLLGRIILRPPTWLWNPTFLAGDRVVRGAMADPAEQAREDHVCGPECLGPEP